MTVINSWFHISSLKSEYHKAIQTVCYTKNNIQSCRVCKIKYLSYGLYPCNFEVGFAISIIRWSSKMLINFILGLFIQKERDSVSSSSNTSPSKPQPLWTSVLLYHLHIFFKRIFKILLNKSPWWKKSFENGAIRVGFLEFYLYL